MSDNGYVLLDTRVFDEAIEKKEQLLIDYNSLNEDYDAIVKELLQNWKGRGASAFKHDALTVKSNLVGIHDILKTMCDVLSDCKEIFSECDAALGEYNRHPDAEQK